MITIRLTVTTTPGWRPADRQAIREIVALRARGDSRSMRATTTTRISFQGFEYDRHRDLRAEAQVGAIAKTTLNSIERDMIKGRKISAGYPSLSASRNPRQRNEASYGVAAFDDFDAKQRETRAARHERRFLPAAAKSRIASQKRSSSFAFSS